MLPMGKSKTKGFISNYPWKISFVEFYWESNIRDVVLFVEGFS